MQNHLFKLYLMADNLITKVIIAMAGFFCQSNDY